MITRASAYIDCLEKGHMNERIEHKTLRLLDSDGREVGTVDGSLRCIHCGMETGHLNPRPALNGTKE